MLVNESNKVLVNANGKIILNDPVNEFLGTFNNLWSFAANWSLGLIPVDNHIAIIRANCVISNNTALVRNVIVMPGITVSINNAGGVNLRTKDILNNGLIKSSTTNAGNSTLVVNEFTGNGLGNIENTNASHSITLNLSPTLTVFTINAAFFSNIVGDVLIMFVATTMAGGASGTVNNTLNVEALNSTAINKSTLYIVSQKSNLTYYKTIIKGSLTGFSVIRAWGGAHYIQINPECTLIESIGVLDFSGNNVSTEFQGNTTLKCNTLICSQSTLIPVNCVVEFRNNGIGRSLINTSYLSLNVRVHNILIYDQLDTAALTNIVNTKVNGASSSSELKFHVDAVYNFFGNQGTDTTDFMNAGVVSQMPAQFNYAFAGNQNIKALSTYRQLGISTSGVKKLIGNTQCEHLYFSGTATLDLNGFSLTGYTKYTDIRTLNNTIPALTVTDFTFGGNNTLTKTLGGNINCVNAIQIQATSVNAAGYKIYCTNFYHSNGGGNNNINPADVVHTNYYIDNNFQNQTIVGGTYNNLYITATGGTKTLSGNIIVTGSYSRNSGSILNKNGFTIKDGSGNDLE